MMIDTIKKMNCESYLLVNTSTPYLKSDSTQLRVRWQVKRNLKDLGFLPFFPGWSIKPIDDKKYDAEIREKLKSYSYDLPVKINFLSVPRQSLEKLEQYTNEIKVKERIE